MRHDPFTRLAGWCAMLAAPIALLSFFLGPIAFGWDFDAMFDPARAIAHAQVDAGLVRWGWVLDILGYYWLLLPVLVLLRDRAPVGKPLHARLAAGAGHGYMICGSIGAAILAGTTHLFDAFAQGDDTVRTATSAVYATIFHLVYTGLWNILGMSLLAIWLWIVGELLRATHNALGLFAKGLAVCAALDVLGLLLGLDAVSMPGLFAYLFLFPVWSAWLGVWLIGKDNPLASSITPQP